MKIFTLVALFTFCAILTNAQITKGSTMVGGSVSGSSTEQDDDQNSEIRGSQWFFGMKLGRFIANNKAVGLYADYYISLSKNNYTGPFPYSSRYENNGFGAGLFYRQYFPLSTKWFLFGEASMGYTKNVSENEMNGKLTSKTKGWSTGAFITPGVSFAAGRRLLIESSFSNLFGLVYNKSESEEFSLTGAVTNTMKNKSFGAQANLIGFNSIQFGLRWILPGKSK